MITASFFCRKNSKTVNISGPLQGKTTNPANYSLNHKFSQKRFNSKKITLNILILNKYLYFWTNLHQHCKFVHYYG